MTYVKIDNQLYEAEINGLIRDTAWDDRQTKTVVMAISYDALKQLMPDDVVWSIVDDDGEYNNSDFCLSGDITDHRDGTCSIKMGKLTLAEELILGGAQDV